MMKTKMPATLMLWMPLARCMLVAIACGVVLVLSAASPPDGRQAVVAALDASAVAWSRGDLDAFMQCYEVSPDTVYIAKTGPVRGIDAIKARYAARYGKSPGSMGKLDLSVLDYRQLGTDYALLTGRFALTKPGAVEVSASGVFTLVFHKSSAGWRIISDHTS